MIELTNLTRQELDSPGIVAAAEKVLRGEKAGRWDISIVFVGCAKIKELNKKFRKINKPTDVLSFSGLENQRQKEKVGEIFVCPKMVAKNAMEWAIVHSVLHLLGYSHEGSQKDAERMRKKEEKYLKK